MTTNTLTSNQWVSQFSNSAWGGTGCKNASVAMLSKDGATPNEAGVIQPANTNSTGQATTANSEAQNGIHSISNTLDNGQPVMIGVDYQKGGNKSDGLTDHYVVIDAKTETLSGGKVTNTSFHFMETGVGAHNKSLGTQAGNTFSVKNNLLKGSFIHSNNNYSKNYTVTKVFPNK